jgi:hypothetical protein
MPGLDPGIHQLRKSLTKKMDCRVKPGNDEVVKPGNDDVDRPGNDGVG